MGRELLYEIGREYRRLRSSQKVDLRAGPVPFHSTRPKPLGLDHSPDSDPRNRPLNPVPANYQTTFGTGLRRAIHKTARLYCGHPRVGLTELAKYDK